MRKRWNRDRTFDVEYELEAGRPRPSHGLMRSIESRIQRRDVRVGGNLRFALAAGLTAALIVPFVAFGALGGGTSTVSHVAKNIARVVHLAAPAHQAPAAHPAPAARPAAPASHSSASPGSPKPQSVVVTTGARASDDPSPAAKQYGNQCKQEARAKYQAHLAANQAQFQHDKHACHGDQHCIDLARHHRDLADMRAKAQLKEDLKACKH
jgi:hypothetical protein